MEFVTVVNRTQETLTGTFDSRQYELTPGKHEFPRDKATKFVEQNPVMGSENPRTGDMIYKLGIEELRMDCSPLTPEFLARFQNSVERWDRSRLDGARPSEIVAGDNGLYGNRANVGQSLPASGSFVDPNR